MKKQINDQFISSEYEFYKFYFNVMNIRRLKKFRLTGHEIQLISIICSKPMEYFLDKKKSKNYQSKNFELAKELKVTRSALYNLRSSIITKGILIEDEDSLLSFPKEIQVLRRVIKDNLAKDQKFEFDYVFNFTIEEQVK